MSAATISKRASVTHFSRILANNYETIENEDGTLLVKGMPVFRSGTFRDSMGDQHTWEVEHLTQMVFNFDLLRDRGLFIDVPVRDGHRSWNVSSKVSGRVVGYIESIYLGSVTDKGHTPLLADYILTQSDAIEMFQNGTFRARSAEVGYYETNEDVLYWPVFSGFAFVDIGAVEHLFNKDKGDDTQFTVIRDNEEGTMPRSKDTGGSPTTTPPQGGQHAQGQPGSEGTPPATPPTPTTPPPAQQAHGAPAPAQPTPPQPPAQQGGFTFNLFGQPVTDPTAVQAHITNLETLNAEFARQGRVSFVQGLADRNVIPATQVEGMTEHAESLTQEQFETFRSMWENAPSNPLFANHGGGPSNPDGNTGTTDDGDPAEIEVLREQVAFARRTGMTEEQIENSKSYKRLQVLEAKQPKD